MTIELYGLAATGVLLLVLTIVSTALYGNQVGNPALMGDREAIPAPVGAARRAMRAHQNLLENAVPFAIAVVVARALHVSTPLTQGAAIVFIAARVIHALVYIAGIPMIRTLAWVVGVMATVTIFVAALG